MIRFDYSWDWHLFATPCIEIGDTVGYPFIMFRCAWFWCSIELHKD